MRNLDKHATMRPATERGTFVEIRDPDNRKLLARYNPKTREIEVVDNQRRRHTIDLSRYS